MNPDLKMTEAMKRKLEKDGSRVLDLHIWRLGPGHLASIVSVVSNLPKTSVDYYKNKLKSFKAVKHLTVEVLEKRKEW